MQWKLSTTLDDTYKSVVSSEKVIMLVQADWVVLGI